MNIVGRSSSSKRRAYGFLAFGIAVTLGSSQSLLASAAGAALPWEAPLMTVARSLTGPVAFGVALIALAVIGGTMVFVGELTEFARRSVLAVLAIALLVGSSSFMAILFVGSGAIVN